MRIAICGLPCSGKSTLFKALVGQANQPKTHASGKAQLNLGTLEVRDSRLSQLGQMLNSEKITYPKITLVDLGYTAEASSKGVETAQIREFEALVVVIAVFSSPDSVSDLTNIEQEFILADLQMAQNRIERINKEKKGRPQKEEDPELALVKRCAQTLEAEKFVSTLGLPSEQLKLVAGFQFLTLKPIVVVANISEQQLTQKATDQLEQKARAAGFGFLAVCAKLESEIEELAAEERETFLKEMGLTSLSTEKFIQASFLAQGLISFFTVVGKEARAWPIRQGTSALAAAGCIHSDMERGFIRAEVINHKDFAACGGFPQAKEKGLLRLESKEYVVSDGDIINFKFSV
ncbi:DUF933 domain-containing protein [Candidatus Omnitrophota bacterium]